TSRDVKRSQRLSRSERSQAWERSLASRVRPPLRARAGASRALPSPAPRARKPTRARLRIALGRRPGPAPATAIAARAVARPDARARPEERAGPEALTPKGAPARTLNPNQVLAPLSRSRRAPTGRNRMREVTASRAHPGLRDQPAYRACVAEKT